MSSWSGTRKRLERELLCEKLRGRVQYFLTRYHGAPDEYGRFAVRLDGKEIVFANPYNERHVSRAANKIKAELGETRPWWELYEHDRARYDEIFRRADAHCIERNAMEVYHVTDAIRAYLNAPIEASLASENAAVRMFAVLDRRVGKRTLAKLSESVSRQPEWLRPFYEVRLRAEGLPESALKACRKGTAVYLPKACRKANAACAPRACQKANAAHSSRLSSPFSPM